MYEGGQTACICVFLILLAIDILLFGFDAALSNLTRKDVMGDDEEPDKKAAKLLALMERPPLYRYSLQTLLMTVNLIAGVFLLRPLASELCRAFMYGVLKNAPVLVSQILSHAIVVIAISLVIGVLGMVIPEGIAARHPYRTASVFRKPAMFLIALFMPAAKTVAALGKGLMAMFGAGEDDLNEDVTEEEIISMVQEGHEQGVIEESEAQMINNIFEFGDKEARDIMTHRTNVLALDGNLRFDEAVAFMLSENNSRYPVYEDTLDRVIGILFLKDAMRYQAAHQGCKKPIRDIKGLLRNPVFVPETKNIDDLFREMQRDKLQMVIVIDEYGQMEGLVAMEDILEEIVGNIRDEYDEDGEYIEEKGNNEYIMEGQTPLEELEELLGISFENEVFETLNGFMIARLDRIPEQDEDFDVDYEGYNFRILKVENKMIASVRVTKLPEIEEEHDTDA